jgi:hypothetical protein
MQGGSPARSAHDWPQWWVVATIRLLLLIEGVGLWALVIVLPVRYGWISVLYGGIPAVLRLLGPALLLGIPALNIALRPTGPRPGPHMWVFLLLNALGAVGGELLAFSQPDPDALYAVMGVAAGSATVLIAIGRRSTPVLATIIAAAVLLVAYTATYALPPTMPPAPALHFRGVIIYPPSAEGTATAGQGFEQADGWTAATVTPGTYRYAQACNGDWDHPTWASVQVPWGAVVRARDQCPALGAVRGYASYTPCVNVPGRDCHRRPFTGQRIAFQDISWGGVSEATTDDSGYYMILLPPGTYTVGTEFSYVLTTGPLEITVESGAAKDLDLMFRPGP